MPVRAAFARDPATATYYEQRAREYDDWYTGEGLFATLERPGWAEELARVVATLERLPPARTLDVACGTGFLTRHLRGLVVGVDQSRSMVAIAQARLSGGLALVGDALRLPFADGSFDRLLAAHFYGHLPPDERTALLAEARRVAAELILIDTAARPGGPPERWEERRLNDGLTHRVYKRYLSAEQIVGTPLLDGRWFVAARRAWRR